MRGADKGERGKSQEGKPLLQNSIISEAGEWGSLIRALGADGEKMLYLMGFRLRSGVQNALCFAKDAADGGVGIFEGIDEGKPRKFRNKFINEFADRAFGVQNDA